jgi:hypothetical protein
VPSFTIDFTPTFAHTDWVDNVDRVEAGGDNGFNQRFHALEDNLETISTTFDDVESALNTLGTPPGAVTRFSTLAPAFVPTSNAAWSFRDGFAEKPGGATQASGQAAFPLPHGQTITGFRAVGQNNSTTASLRLTLFRRPLANPTASQEQIARVTPTGNPFDSTAAPAAGLELIDNERFSYFVLAQLNTAQAADVVAITAFQVTHTTT